MINAAVVGLGRWGQRLVESVQGQSDKIGFVSAVSRDPARHQAFSSRHGLKGTQSYDEVLADPNVHAVVLATPHSQHHRQILDAAAAGKHVFVEKPITLKRAHAVEAVSALEANGLALGVGFSRRFTPAFNAMVDTIRSGEIGELLHLEAQLSGPSGHRLKPGAWRASRSECPAGSMTPRGIHVLDCLIHIAGPVTAVSAISERRIVEVETDDTTAMLLRHAGGVTAYLATIFVTANIWRVQAYGSKGHVEMRGENTLVTTALDGTSRTISFVPIDKERAALEAFADAARGGGPYPVSGAEAINGIATLEAIAESAATQSWVTLG